VTVLLLVRHGTTELTGKRLYGRTPGVHLSEEGRRQADHLADRLRPLRLSALYASPMERCIETAEPVAEATGLEVHALPGLAEIDYGRWAGRSFASLARTRLWRRAHRVPSGVRFPDGETLGEAQLRTVRTLEEIAERHPRGSVAVITHGDVIRLALAHYAGVHLDLYQRLEAGPGSVSAVALREGMAAVLRLNDMGTLEDLAPPRRRGGPSHG
jgi:probable phosphoglycerate mutase